MKRRRVWKIVLGLLGGILLVVVGIVLDANRRAGAALDRNRAEVEKGIVAFHARDRARASCFLETTDGNAWDHYGPALKAIADIPEDLADLVPEIQGTSDPEMEHFSPDDHALHTLFREYASTLAAFEKGARCRVVEGPRMDFRPGAGFPFITEAMRASRFLAGAISHRHRMGRDSEVIPLALAGLQFGQDSGRYGLLVHSLVGYIADGTVVWSLREALEDHAFSAEDLAALASGLDRLAASRPDCLDCWEGEDLYLRSQYLDAEWASFFRTFTSGEAPTSRSTLAPWRCLFSQRITRAQALGLLSEWFSTLPALRPLPPWQRLAGTPPLEQDMRSSGNPIFDAGKPFFHTILRRDAMLRTEHALLRTAVAIARFELEKGRPPAGLEDLVPKYLPNVPVCALTGQILRFKEGKLWSVGKDGVDDGGTPGRNNDGNDESGDQVWTVKRR